MILAAVLLHAMLGSPVVCPVQGSVNRCVSFEFEMPGAAVPKYFVVVHEDSLAYYWEGMNGYDAARQRKPELTVSAATMKKVFAAKVVEDSCETKEKNIAQTGKKTLTLYEGTRGWTCSFNYSDDATVMEATSAFMAIAETMQEGEKLQHELRFDRLGLDAELDFLMDEVKGGRAIEVQNIAPVLEAIVGDERVMERVRRKAGQLLEDVAR